jgi:hypothetical protein
VLIEITPTGDNGFMDDAKLALLLARGRIAIGVAMVVAPGLVARRMSATSTAYGLELPFARMIGARDLALGLGIVVALDRGAPVRGWLEGAALADTADCFASLAARKQLGRGGLIGTVGLASISAVVGAVLARRLEPAPSAHPGQPEAVVTGHPE